MSRIPGFLVVLALATGAVGADQHWPFSGSVTTNAIARGGSPESVPGVVGNAVRLDGQTVIEAHDSAALGHNTRGFTFTIWLNPYDLTAGQQMIAAKNRYSLNQREWGVMVDKDGQLRLYAWQGGWKTTAWTGKLQPGHWHLIAVTCDTKAMTLFVDGHKTGSIPLAKPLPHTTAPLTFGGVNDNGRVWQNLFGALDEARLVDRVLSDAEMRKLHHPVTATHVIPARTVNFSIATDARWMTVARQNARDDRTTTIFDGITPNKLVCDTTLRPMPDGSWVMIMLGGGDTEPLPQNRVFLTRSHDEGRTWSPMAPIDLGVKATNANAALVPSELMVLGNRCTMFVATHDGTFANWKEWLTHSEDSCRTWSPLQPAPGRLRDRTFIRNHIVTRDGRILLPFQHYLRVAATRRINKGRRFSAPTDPRNGVLMSRDNGRTWTEHGNIRLTNNDDYSGWAENNIVELSDGRIAMIIRRDGGGVLYYAESPDGGRTWPVFARKTAIPNPGSKATLHPLGGDAVALLHNPNPRQRSPLALWISFDGMKTWPYQRVLFEESSDGPQGRLNYPDGFVSADRRHLHFAFDDNRHRAVYVDARLPTIPEKFELWNADRPLPKSAAIKLLDEVEFHAIKKWEPEVDGYHWLHGIALAWHKGRLFASFGHNVGKENTLTEEGRYCVSDDGGSTWSPVKTIDVGTETENLAVSHGVFHSYDSKLWAFLGAFHDTRKRVHTRAYTLNEATGNWQPHGIVVTNGFWPMQQPVKMDNGNWIMAGLMVGEGNPAAVAISHGDDFTKWKPVRIDPGPEVGRMWGESTVIVEGQRILNIARYGQHALALASVSDDYGQSWSPLAESNLPLTPSKPAAGVLSTGQRYLVGTTTADSGNRRYPLTMALSRPGETNFSSIHVIRRAEFPAGPGESHPQCALAYPYAVEHDGRLYVAYSNSAGRGGNRNSAELAVIPLESLR